MAAQHRSTPEPYVWLLFSGGGMVAALVLPALLLLLGVLVPLGLVGAPDFAHLLAVLRFPLTRLALLGICFLSLVHAAHRFRYTLQDGLKLKRFEVPIAGLCYGAALVGSAAAAYLLFAAL